MPNTIILKRSSVPGKVPTASQVTTGELALNTYDGKLYAGIDDGTAKVVQIAGVSTGSTGPLAATRTLLDDIAPGFNGTTTTFNLTASSVAFTPANALALEVILGGVQQKPGVDYTVSGSQIVFTAAPAANSPCFIIGSTYAMPVMNAIADRKLVDDISAGFNGSAVTFNLTVSASPYSPGSALGLDVVLGGVQQRPTTDYTVSGSTITFTSAPAAGLTCLIIGWVASSSLAAVATSGSANDVSGLTEAAQDAAAAMFLAGNAGNNGVTFTYIDNQNLINASVEPLATVVSSYEACCLSMHMNGANNSTTFTDDSNQLENMVAYSAAKISTTQSKFGGSSAFFDGNGSYIQSSYNGDQDLLNTPFTYECWIYPTSLKSGFMRIAATGGGANAWNSTNGIHTVFQLTNTGALNLQIATGTATPVSATTTATVPLNQWTYVTASYWNTTISLGINGKVESFTSATNAVRPSGNPAVAIGTIPGETGAAATNFQGYIDELQLHYVAKYTSDFKVPTGPLPDYGATYSAELLYRGSGANAPGNGQLVTDGLNLYVCVSAGTTNYWYSIPFQGSPNSIQLSSFSDLLDYDGTPSNAQALIYNSTTKKWQPTSLAAVAISGSASDITSGTLAAARLPSVNLGTTAVDLTRASGALSLTGVSIDGSAGSVAWTNVSGRPTALSNFTNDAGFLTSIPGCPTFIQATQPSHPGPYLWLDTTGGNLQIKYHDGV